LCHHFACRSDWAQPGSARIHREPTRPRHGKQRLLMADMGLARLVANPPPDRRRCMLDLGEGVQLPRHGHVLVPSHVPVPRSRPDTGPVTVGIGPRSRPCIMNPSLFVPWPSLRQCRGDLAQCTHPSRAYKALQTAMTTKGRTPGGGTPSHTSPECSACVRLCVRA
jgi:hypothetical protein